MYGLCFGELGTACLNGNLFAGLNSVSMNEFIKGLLPVQNNRR